MINSIKYQQCNRCLYIFPSIGIEFNKNGICSGCEIHEEKDKIDWAPRLLKLKN